MTCCDCLVSGAVQQGRQAHPGVHHEPRRPGRPQRLCDLQLLPHLHWPAVCWYASPPHSYLCSAQCTTLLHALHCTGANDALPALLSGCHLQTCPPRGIFALCLLPTKYILRSPTDQRSHELPPLTLSASELPCAHDKTFLHMPLYTYVDICDVVVQASPCRTPSPTPLLTCWAPFPLRSRRSTSWRCAVALAST